MHAVETWLAGQVPDPPADPPADAVPAPRQAPPPDVRTFPYGAVLADFHRVGKHFVAEDLLAALDAARASVPAGNAPLAPFLGTTLDKWDGRYDYLTDLALDLLPLPTGTDVAAAALQRDRLVALLVADAVHFELAARGGSPLLPELRPDERTTAKRCRLAMRVLAAPGARIDVPVPELPDPVAAAEQACAAVRDRLCVRERLAMQLSMLPVYVAHDEYLFIRVLQSFETTFALQVVQLRAAVCALTAGEAAGAVALLRAATAVLRESAPLFSLLATMQVESFRLFRQFTEGASAIQSNSYKAVESLCRRPDEERLASLAYRSVPPVRRRILEDPPVTVEDALIVGRVTDRLTVEEQHETVAAMRELADALGHWRQTHYRLAVRMLGDRTGTGYSEGTPYLRHGLGVPVFTPAATGGAPAPDRTAGEPR
jgi:tryptophan 2,3-dioxygenase